MAHVVERWARLSAQQRRCTPQDVAPARPAGRRIAVLVGGLGSTATSASVDRVDTSALGVAPDDVLRFSYAGGRVPDATDARSFASIAAQPYSAFDTTRDLEVAADRLVAMLQAVAAAAPGVPIDVIGHSQGGVVARLAIGLAGADGRLPAEVASLATLAAPHGGADLATAAAAARGLPPEARSLLDAAGYSAEAVSVRQLSEVSGFIRSLDDHPVPARVARVSIAARGDLVVASPRTAAADFPNVVVDVVGPQAHERPPGQLGGHARARSGADRPATDLRRARRPAGRCRGRRGRVVGHRRARCHLGVRCRGAGLMPLQVGLTRPNSLHSSVGPETVRAVSVVSQPVAPASILARSTHGRPHGARTEAS